MTRKQSLLQYSTPDLPISTSNVSGHVIGSNDETPPATHSKSPTWFTQTTWEEWERADIGEAGEGPGSDDECEGDGHGNMDIDEMEVDNELVHIHPRYWFQQHANMESKIYE